LVIIIGSGVLQTGVSALTFIKGTLLAVMVCVIAIVGISANQAISNDWSYIGRPFLLGTVALGGAVNILPVTFSKIQSKSQDISKYLRVSVAALFVVWILNIFWCYFILKIIPQSSGETNLYQSEALGQISTIPLVEIIHQQYPNFIWIAGLVDVFITISITVSYITMGTGAKHVLDGYMQQNEQSVIGTETLFDDNSFMTRTIAKVKSVKVIWKKAVLYVLCFGTILVIAQANPRAFIVIMEKVTSLALNLEAGVFVSIMLTTSQNFNQSIPYPINEYIYKTRYVVIAYFLFAIIYDCVSIVLQTFNINVL